jgi:hypothetical protein
MILKETLQELKSKISRGQGTPKEFMNLVKEYEKIADWEEKSFEEVDVVVKASNDFSENIDMSIGFPQTVINIFDLCKSLITEKKETKIACDSLKADCSKKAKAHKAEVDKLNKEIKKLKKRAQNAKTKPAPEEDA